MRFFRSRARREGLRLFFATDIHGSEQCFRKFLNAGEFYGASVLVLGGDITGKILIPIERQSSNTYAASYGENVYRDMSEREVTELKARIRRAGHYYYVGSADELRELEDDGHRDAIFRRIVRESAADWITLAEERLRGTGRRCFVAPGNDDFMEIDSALAGSDVVEFAERRCIEVDEVHEMITTGYSNPTPWHTERELPEPQLRARIDGMAASVRRPEHLIAVLHPPPYGSMIDNAPRLDDDLRMSAGAGGVELMPVGSTAVRDFIEEHQPLLGLHGHVHEGRGTAEIGRTLCINPGSEYTQGVLSGALVELSDGEVVSHQLVTG
jgi:Icc-related predicted phosphoesterase